MGPAVDGDSALFGTSVLIAQALHQLPAARRNEVERELAGGARLRLTVESDAEDILGARVDLVSTDGIAQALCEWKINYVEG